ncbi:hypothetical protein LZ31DRAFT_201504 [Colletotrichum somersetense]|nr:hypothetical protein LZ31DRAFT_201504 [Colletotrichum somersetense]
MDESHATAMYFEANTLFILQEIEHLTSSVPSLRHRPRAPQGTMCSAPQARALLVFFSHSPRVRDLRFYYRAVDKSSIGVLELLRRAENCGHGFLTSLVARWQSSKAQGPDLIRLEHMEGVEELSSAFDCLGYDHDYLCYLFEEPVPSVYYDWSLPM